MKTARALSLYDGLAFVTPEHIQELAVPVLAHRIALEAVRQQVHEVHDAGEGVHRLVDWLGGSIVLDSSRETGTCFTVTIPMFLHHPEEGPEFQPEVEGEVDEVAAVVRPRRLRLVAGSVCQPPLQSRG